MTKETTGDAQPLTNTLDLHNLTQLRKQLEEKMVLTLNAHNRPADQMADQWPTYPATPSDSYDAQSIGSGGRCDSMEDAYDEAYS